MVKEKDTVRAPKFTGSIAYVTRPMQGINLYNRTNYPTESTDEMLEKLTKQEIEEVKKQEFMARLKGRAVEAQNKQHALEKGQGLTSPLDSKERRFSIIDNKPMLDSEGDYTFNEALRVCATDAGAKAGVSGDKVSDIINAIQPLLVERKVEAQQGEEKKLEQSLLLMVLESLRGKSDAGDKQMSPLDVLTIAEKLHDMTASRQGGEERSPLDDMAKLATTFQMLKGAFGGNSNQGPGQVVVQMPGMEGKTMPMDAYFTLDNHIWNRQKQQEEFKDKRENAKSVREFVGGLAQAASQMAGRGGAAANVAAPADGGSPISNLIGKATEESGNGS